MNHSVDLPTTLINRSVQHTSRTSRTGKGRRRANCDGGFFSQHLNSGPLAHLTIVQQGSGPIELSSSFDNLMTTLDRKGISELSGTLIHPYHLLKTCFGFRHLGAMAVKRSTVEPKYADSFEIDSTAIERIFGSPKESKRDLLS